MKVGSSHLLRVMLLSRVCQFVRISTAGLWRTHRARRRWLSLATDSRTAQLPAL